MSLLKWSTPERRKEDQILPVIPNEIYFDIFDHIAPSTEHLSPEEIATFSNLSRVCTLFANFCLPRIFELVGLRTFVDRDDALSPSYNSALLDAMRGATLCKRIAAERPLSLSLAKYVKSCYFVHWRRAKTEKGLSEARLLATKYLSAMIHMGNLRELKFFACKSIDMEHWQAISQLSCLEKLFFYSCDFQDGPADVKPEKRLKIRVAHLQVVDCTGLDQPIAAIEPAPLRTLVTDFAFFILADWLPRSGITELCFHGSFMGVLRQLEAILARTPQSVSTLSLGIHGDGHEPGDIIIPGVFDEPAWNNVSFLRSLKLVINSFLVTSPEMVISSSLNVTRLLTSLESFTLQYESYSSELPTKKIQNILHRRVGPASCLKRVELNGKVFHLVDGKWAGRP